MPAALIVEATAGADSADDRVAGDFDVLDSFDDVLEDGAEMVTAEGVNPGGMSVAVERARVREIEISDDRLRADPSQEGFINIFPVGMAADCAFASVTGQAGSRRELSVLILGNTVGGHSG